MADTSKIDLEDVALSTKSKGDAKHNETRADNGLSEEENLFLENFSPQRRKKVLRKIDVRLLPLLGLFYIFSFLDRANIGSAPACGPRSSIMLANYNQEMRRSKDW